MAAHRLLTLGTLQVIDGSGQPIDFPAGKPLALLIRLVVGPAAPTRRELAQLLWSRSTPERGLQSVRQALWLIRRTIGDCVVETDGVLTLRADCIASDVASLEHALSDGGVADADRLWEGPFLHRLIVSDAPEWDRWSESVRDGIANRLAAAVFADALVRRDAGDVVAARRGMERAARIAPFEPRYREELVGFLVELRDLQAAEEAIGEARQVAAEPDQQEMLDRLGERLDEMRADRTAVPEERLARPDLVGRSAELADLMAFWRRVQKGGKRIALLTGPGGIGKSRLADEFARTVRHEDAAVVTVRAAEAEQVIDNGVVASLARALLQLPGAAGISTSSDTLLRGLAPSLPNRNRADPDGHHNGMSSAGLADALADLIGAVVWERPLLIVIDDAAWADRPSIAVFARALRTTHEGRVMVVLTARAPGAGNGLLRPLETIGGEVAFAAVRLRSLTRAETHELVALLVDLSSDAAERRFLDRVHATTGGNPFYVIELIRAFVAQRLVRIEDRRVVLDLARLDADGPWPRSVHALVRGRFERLSPEARALAHMIATVSPREPEAAARWIAGLGRRAYGRAVTELVEHAIIAWDSDALVFTHAELRQAAADWREEDEARPAAVRARHGVRIGVGLVGLAVVVLLASRALLVPAAPPYGGGGILLAAGDSVVFFRVERAGGGVRGRATRPEFRVPSLDRLRAFRTATGELLWFRDTRTKTRGPDIVAVRAEDDRQTPIIARPGDDNLAAVSPDGRWIAFGSEDVNAPYDPGVHIARVDGSEARLLMRGRGAMDWSSDGRNIVAIAPGRPDSLLVLTPGGRLEAAQAGTQLTSAIFCGDGRIVFTSWIGDRPAFVLWNWRTGEERILPLDILLVADCSPDGTAALAWAAVDRMERFGVVDLETGAFIDLGIGAVKTAKLFPAWLPDRPWAVPTALSLAPDSVLVDWGGVDSVFGGVTLSDGSRATAHLDWTSADSSVATISAAGILKGNGPGSTVVRGCVDDWICDTVVVGVRSTPATGAILFEDRFDGALDTVKWWTFGAPKPRTVRAPDGDTVLFLNGDGSWADGMMSRETFGLSQGATLEVQFRYRGGIHRTDRQSATFCLMRYDVDSPPPENEETDQFVDARVRGGVCFSYPGAELRGFDPSAGVLMHLSNHSNSPVSSTAFPPVEWVDIALQVVPDGRVTLFVNRKPAAELRLKLDGVANDDWRIEMQGHSVDTRLEVRNVTLWPGRQF